MKKILVAAAIAVSAFAANAAAVTWTVTNVQPSPTAAASAGWLIQLYDAGTTFNYDAAKSGTITALDSTTSYASGTIFRSQSTFGDYAALDPVNVYAVVFDAATVDNAKNFLVSSVVNKSINAAGSPLTIAFGNMASTSTSNQFRNSQWAAASSTPTPDIPEPTSAMLVLLGVAGLALKRKRA